MEINSIEVLYATLLAHEQTMAPFILTYFVDKDTRKFYEFRMRVSTEFVQDLHGMEKDVADYHIKDSIISSNNMVSTIKDCKEVTSEYMLETFSYDESIKKYVLTYIREEKLNKILK